MWNGSGRSAQRREGRRRRGEEAFIGFKRDSVVSLCSSEKDGRPRPSRLLEKGGNVAGEEGRGDGGE